MARLRTHFTAPSPWQFLRVPSGISLPFSLFEDKMQTQKDITQARV